MARLPFQQATVLPQQNRLSAPNVPNAPGVMPTQVPGQNIQAQAFQDLGKTIGQIGITAADIYLSQAEKAKDEEEKIAIVQVGELIDIGFNEHVAGHTNNPAADATEAMLRYDLFLNGEEGVEGSGFKATVRNQYKNSSKRVKRAVEQLLNSSDIQTRQRLKIQAIDRNNSFQVSQAVVKGKQSLFEYGQNLGESNEYFVATAPLDETAFTTKLGNDLNEAISSALEGLTPAQQTAARQRLQADSLRMAQGVIQLRDNFIKEELRADYARKEVELLKSTAPREERLADYEQDQLEKAKKRLIDPDDVIKLVVAFEQRLDDADFANGKLTDPEGLLEKLKTDDSFLPTLNLREIRAEKILQLESFIQTKKRQGLGAVRKDIAFATAAILSGDEDNPQKVFYESEDNINNLVSQLPDENERTIARGQINYAKLTVNTLQDLAIKDIVELEQVKETLRPPLFFDGVSNLELDKFKTIYNRSLKIIEEFQKERKENGASFYQRNEGESAFNAAVLEQVVDEQLRYLKLDNTQNLTPQELRGLLQGGYQGHTIRLFSDQDIMVLANQYRGTQNGAERKRLLQTIEAEAGTLFGPLVMVELARKETEDGIALPYRAMLYTEMREDGTIQNLYNAEVNAKNNRANVRQLFGNANESIANVQQAMVANDQVQSFFNSFKIDPGADAVRTEFQELMLDYVLELGNRMPVMSLGDAVDKMAEHIVQENYEFIQPNPDTAPTRLKKSQMGIHSAGEIEQALIQYTDRLLAERESPEADLAATDDLYAWKVRGDESGLELVFLNENRGAQFSSRQKILSFSELMVVTEDYKNARTAVIGEEAITERIVAPATELQDSQELDPAAQEREAMRAQFRAQREAAAEKTDEEPVSIEHDSQDRAELLEEAQKQDPAAQERQRIREKLRTSRKAPAEQPEEEPADNSMLPVGVGRTGDPVLEKEIEKRYGAAQRRMRTQVRQFIEGSDGRIPPEMASIIEAQIDMHLDNASQFMRYNDPNKKDRGSYTEESLPLLAEELAIARSYQQLLEDIKASEGFRQDMRDKE